MLGIEPMREFEERDRDDNDVNEPIVLGIVPLIMLPFKYKEVML